MNIFLNCQIFSGIIFAFLTINSVDIKKTNTENIFSGTIAKIHWTEEDQIGF